MAKVRVTGMGSGLLEDMKDIIGERNLVSTDQVGEDLSVVDRGRVREVVRERHFVAPTDPAGSGKQLRTCAVRGVEAGREVEEAKGLRPP